MKVLLRQAVTNDILDSVMEANPVRIVQYFDGKKQSLIPLFQRPYTWDKPKWSALWEDILACHGEDGPTSHFLGAVVSIPANTTPVGVNKHLVIDGQQRLTTVAVILVALRDVLIEQGNDKVSKLVDDYLINHNNDDPEKLKLLPTHVDRDAYRSLALDRSLLSASSRIRTSYDYFKKEIGKDGGSSAIDPVKLFDTIEQCLQVVMINLADTDDPYVIFESLNAKGEPLTQADLVRNHLLMRFKHSVESGGEQERIYNTYWRPIQDSFLKDDLTSFLRHYCMKDGVNVKEKAVYSAIKSRLAKFGGGELESELANMKRSGDFYARFIDPSREANPSVRSRLAAFKALGVTTCYPLLLRLFASHADQKISGDDLERCLHLIESFVVRRAVCAVPTNSLGKFFVQWSKDCREDDVVRWLGQKMKDGAGNSRWPTDAQFKAEFHGVNQYDRLKSTMHVLASLEGKFADKEPADLSKATVEHVMPQALTPEWKSTLGAGWQDTYDRLLHSFGNLTLTGYNSELGNLRFDEKKDKLSDSRIVLNRWIREQSVWDASVIEARAAMLADRAAGIWPGPESLT